MNDVVTIKQYNDNNIAEYYYLSENDKIGGMPIAKDRCSFSIYPSGCVFIVYCHNLSESVVQSFKSVDIACGINYFDPVLDCVCGVHSSDGESFSALGHTSFDIKKCSSFGKGNPIAIENNFSVLLVDADTNIIRVIRQAKFHPQLHERLVSFVQLQNKYNYPDEIFQYVDKVINQKLSVDDLMMTAFVFLLF